MSVRMGKIGVYGSKTRLLQRRITFEAFGLSHKEAKFYRYLGDKRSRIAEENKFECKVFYEVPDRAYDAEPVSIPIGVELHMESKTDFSRFGLINPMSDETTFRVHIDDFPTIGREIVVGDVFELPFFEKNGARAFWEVTDVDLKTEYEKFICILHASPLAKSRATRDIATDRDTTNAFNVIMDEMDDYIEEIVPSTDIEYDHTEKVMTYNSDYIKKQHKDFLDNPFAQF